MLGVSLDEIKKMKLKSTDWCSIEGGVPSYGENRVHCLYFAFLHNMHNWLPEFQFESVTFLPGIQVQSATFFSANLESWKSRGVSRIPSSFFPGILVESATLFSNQRAYVRLCTWWQQLPHILLLAHFPLTAFLPCGYHLEQHLCSVCFSCVSISQNFYH